MSPTFNCDGGRRVEGLFWVIVIALAAFAYFGWRGRRVGSSVSHSRSEAQSPPPPPKQPSVAEQIEALRSAIRADFEQREAEKDAAADITTKKAVMVEAQAYLVAAGAVPIIDGFIREAKYWGSWQSKASGYVPDAVVTRDQFSDRDAKGGSRSGYTFEHDGREWTFELQQDPSYGSGHRFGKFRVRQRNDLIFECGISLDYGREFSDWHANLDMVSVFKSADWLVDFAIVTELGRNLTKERDRARMRADAVTRASATTWRRQEDPGDK